MPISTNTPNCLRALVLGALTLAVFGCAEKEQQAAPAAKTGVPDEMVLIPAGEFIMGSDDIDTTGKSEEFGFNEPWYLPEHPQRKLNLKSFYLDLYEVNNGNYKAYLMGTERVHRNELVKLLEPLQLRVNEHPVRNVSWFDATDYCKAVGQRLPPKPNGKKPRAAQTAMNSPGVTNGTLKMSTPAVAKHKSYRSAPFRKVVHRMALTIWPAMFWSGLKTGSMLIRAPITKAQDMASKPKSRAAAAGAASATTLFRIIFEAPTATTFHLRSGITTWVFAAQKTHHRFVPKSQDYPNESR